jgi:predicted lipoprotein with Yx(FWY)xxD motif
MQSRAARRRLRPMVVALAAVGLFAAACGTDDIAEEPTTDLGAEDDADDADVDDVDDAAGEDSGEAEPGEDELADEPGDGVALAVADSPLGEHLVDGEGMTLYLFTEDSEGESVCTDDCLENWPALTVDGEPTWDDGVEGSLVGTIEREDDGSTQVTYDGLPLYTFAPDEAPGDVNGQGSGDVWYVVSPSGEAITEAVESSGPAY